MGLKLNGYSSMKQGVEMMGMLSLNGELYCMDDSGSGVLDEMRHS